MLERRRLESELAQLEVVGLHPRKRVPIRATLAVPHRWICRLTVPRVEPGDRSYGLGTGVLVGPRHVLTAAHVLVSSKDPARTVGDRLRVQVARNGQDEPFDAVGVQGWQVHPQWAIRHRNVWRQQPQLDYGLVTLTKEVSLWRDRRLGDCSLGFWGAAGRCGAGSQVGLTPNDVTGQEVQVTGYPSEKPEGTLWTGRGLITYDRRLGKLLYTADTTPGQSGAPVWFVRNGAACLVGVHSAPSRWVHTTLTHNAGVLLTPDVVRQIESWTHTFER